MVKFWLATCGVLAGGWVAVPFLASNFRHPGQIFWALVLGGCFAVLYWRRVAIQAGVWPKDVEISQSPQKPPEPDFYLQRAMDWVGSRREVKSNPPFVQSLLTPPPSTLPLPQKGEKEVVEH